MRYIKMGLMILGCVILSVSCKMQSKTAEGKKVTHDDNQSVQMSDIVLNDQPLDTIKKYVTGPKWQLIYSVGGITGSDRKTFDNTYYTFSKAGKLITEQAGKLTEHPYDWLKSRDIYSGDSIYIISSGLTKWKVGEIDHDTLRLFDNYPDGYAYSLTRVR